MWFFLECVEKDLIDSSLVCSLIKNNICNFWGELGTLHLVGSTDNYLKICP